VLLASDVPGDRALPAITGDDDPPGQAGQHASPGGPAGRPKDGIAPPGAVRALTVARRGAAGERTQPAACPNGRALTNDVVSACMAFLANGEAGSGGLSDRTTISWPSFLFPGPPDP
jgi:hypothetical protein